MSFALPFLLSFIFALCFAPLFLIVSRRLKFGQNILFYVKEHESKQGTPTMGGVVFIVPIIIFSTIFARGNLGLTFLINSIFLSYALVGFLLIREARDTGSPGLNDVRTMAMLKSSKFIYAPRKLKYKTQRSWWCSLILLNLNAVFKEKIKKMYGHETHIVVLSQILFALKFTSLLLLLLSH